MGSPCGGKRLQLLGWTVPPARVLKYDGIPALAAVDGAGWRLWCGMGADCTARYAEFDVLRRLPAAVAKLPPDELGAYKKLWTDVAALEKWI